MLINIQITISILLIIVILLQNKNVSLSLSSMSDNSAPVSKRGPEKVLQNITILLAIAFTINAILLFVTK